MFVFTMKMLCDDLWRHVFQYLRVQDCLHVEIATRRRFFDTSYYRFRFKYQKYLLRQNKYLLEGYYKTFFKCKVSMQSRKICEVQMFNVSSTKEICHKVLDLLRLY